MQLSLPKSTPAKVMLVAGILLVALNLRAPFTGVVPVLNQIAHDLQLGPVAVGALTSLPLLTFALLSPAGAPIARAVGLERALIGALAAIATGVLLRSSGTAWALYAGTAIIGMGIAVGNVLLPSWVKRDFPGNAASITGAYALTMGIGAALGSALVIPLAQGWGWKGGLDFFVLLPLMALPILFLQLRSDAGQIVAAAFNLQPSNVWGSWVAWSVTLFMGLNAMIFYIAVSWLPAILVDAGMSATTAASLHGVLQLGTAVPGLVLAPILRRLKDQRPVAVAVCLLSAVSLTGLVLAPGLALLWSALLGIGSGASMILGLTFAALRTRDAHQAAALSGMSQSVGYLMAAAGPLMLGALHDVFGGWHVLLLLASCISVMGALAGLMAGQNVFIDTAAQ